MHRVRTAKPREEMFDTPKCTQRIRVANPFVKQALAAVALDRGVTAIDLLPSAYAPPGCGEIILIHRNDARFVLDVVPGRPIVDVDTRRLLDSALRSLGIAPITLTVEDLRQPRYATAEHIWRHRWVRVPLNFRLQVETLFREGGRLAIGEVLTRVRAESGDPLAMICSLACTADVDMDIDGPFGLDTSIGGRR